MTRQSDIEGASASAQPTFEEPFAPGTVLLEDGKFLVAQVICNRR